MNRPSGTPDRYIITHFHIQKITSWRELVAHLIKARNQLPDDKFKPGIESGQKFSQKKKTWACLVSQEQCFSFLCQSYAVIIIFQPAHSQSFSFASQVDNSPQSGFFVERFRWVLLTSWGSRVNDLGSRLVESRKILHNYFWTSSNQNFVFTWVSGFRFILH